MPLLEPTMSRPFAGLTRSRWRLAVVTAGCCAVVFAGCNKPPVRGPEPVDVSVLTAPPQCALPARTAQDPGPMPGPRAANEPVATTLDVSTWNAACDVGAVGLHRLNRTELHNTMKDVLQVPALEVFSLPVDDSSDGFDNLADVLAVSPLLLEKIANVSEELIAQALAPAVATTIQIFEAEKLEAETGNAMESFYRMNGPGTLRMAPNLDTEGTYRMRVRAWGERGGADLPLMGFVVDGVPVYTFEVAATLDSPQVYESQLTLGPDNEVIGVTSANDYFYDGDTVVRDRNLFVDFIELEGPLEREVMPDENPIRSAILTCTPDDIVDGSDRPLGINSCARQIFSRFGLQAWRRQPSDEELVRLLRLVDMVHTGGTPNGEEPFEYGVRLGLRAMLMSPNFLYRVEVDLNENSTGETPVLLSDQVMASRLSYFLWSGPPDARLLELAARKRLQDDAVIEAEVNRMLSDPRARAFVDNFAGQWLQTRGVIESTPDPLTYPTWSKVLARQASCETLNLFDDVLRQGGGPRDLLQADYTFITPDLADFYGLDVSVPPGAYTRVDLAGTDRQGVLTHASVLTVTSNPTRTSPVKRGKWVLEQVMCIPPDPPPPGVEGLPEGVDAETLRERLAQHRADPVCASCHDMMDPIGLALDHSDAVGQWRDTDNGAPIDTSSVFFTGEPFDGHGEMIDLVLANGTVERCATTKMLTYALGRVAEENTDWCALDSITFDAIERGGSLVDIITEIAKSAPFRMRRPNARDVSVVPDPGSDG